MSWIFITRMVMLSALVLLLGYDVIAAFFGGDNATISTQFGYLANHWKDGGYLPFVLGLLAGHLMGEAQRDK